LLRVHLRAREGGNGDLELGLIAIFTGVAIVIGVNLWAKRSGWLMAAIKSALSLALAGILAFAIGADTLLTKGPMAPATDGLASATARLFGREHSPDSRPARPTVEEAPLSDEAEAQATRAALEARDQQAEQAAAEQARQQDMARARADRLTAAEGIIRTVYDDELSLFGSRTERSAWLTPQLSRRIDQANAAAEAYGGAGVVVGFDPLIEGQDVNLANFDYASRETDYGVEVRVRFTNFEDPVDLTFEMVETEGGWRTRQIRSRTPQGQTRWTLTGLLDQAMTDARNFE